MRGEETISGPPSGRCRTNIERWLRTFVAFWFFRDPDQYCFETLSRGGGAGSRPHVVPRSVSAYGVGQLLRTFSIAAYPVLEGTHNLVVVYDRQIGKLVKTLVNRNYGFN